MRVEAEFINSDIISNQHMKNCFDSMKPSKNEETSLVNFKDGRYEVSFPFKEFHQELGDNYLTSKGRLKNLKKIRTFAWV